MRLPGSAGCATDIGFSGVIAVVLASMLVRLSAARNFCSALPHP